MVIRRSGVNTGAAINLSDHLKILMNIPLAMALFSLAATSVLAQLEGSHTEDFALDGGAVVSLLHGRSFGSSSTKWVAMDSLSIFKSNDTAFVSSSSPKSAWAKAPVLNSASEIKVQARVVMAPAAGAGQEWVSIGMGNPPPTSIFWNLGFMMILHANGGVECLYNPEPEGSEHLVRIPTPTIKVDAGSETTLKIEYKREANTVSFWVGDEQVVDSFVLDGYEPLVKFVGFSFSKPVPGSDQVTSFQVDATP